MAWIIKLTETSGRGVYINLDQVVSFAPEKWEKGEGARLRTTITDADHRPVTFLVQETPDKIYDKMLASR